MSPQRVNILGVGVSPINIPIALDTIEEWIANGERHYVCVTNVHGVMESQQDRELRHIFNRSGMTTPDGMPLVWLGRLAGHREMDRVYGPDLMMALTELASRRGYRHFYYGGAEGVPEQLAANLSEKYPGLQVAGTHSPPFRPLTDEEDEQVVEMINQSGADIVWVGLGAPKQERWMAAHVGRLEASVLIGVGAAFDFYTGRVRQAPRWIQRCGMEWFFRLCMEPRRLWRRYVTNNPLFVLNVLLQMVGLKHWTLEGISPSR